MSNATEQAFQDSDVRLLQQMMAKIERLEELAVGIAPGMLVPYTGVVRGAKWSDTHLESIGSLWTHHFQMNDVNESNVAEDRKAGAENGQLKAETSAGLPLMGQPGGLASDGSYSMYFPGKEKSRIECPLLSELTTGFTMEIFLKPEESPQFSVPFYNGVYGTNGWGIQMANAAGTGVGNLLIFRHSSGVVVNTTMEFKPGQWHWIGVTWSGTTLEIGMVRVDPTTKAVTPTGITFTPTIVKPTTGSFIGSASGATAMPFKGWIDEVLVYNGNLSLAEPMGVGSWEDRWQTAIYSSPPPGFILPDGTAVSRAKYDRLFKTIGTIYGAGDGTNTFNLPPLIGRIPVMKAAGSLGTLLGEEGHVLALSEMPSHNHDTNVKTSNTEAGGYGLTVAPAFQDRAIINGGGWIGTSSAGASAAHNNMQPSLLTNYLLKT